MRTRGKIYWDWVDLALHTRSVDERLPDGTLLNIHVRTSALGETQLFIGVYGEKGLMLFEEAFESRPGETMTQAMKWGVERGKEKALYCQSEGCSNPGRLPRAVGNPRK